MCFKFENILYTYLWEYITLGRKFGREKKMLNFYLSLSI